MEIKEMKIGDLVPYENNPRNNDEAVDAVAESIRQCGYIAPIIVDENNVILAGHTRLKALKRLGIDKFPVGVKEGLTEEQKRKYRLLDNKTNEFASWDFEKLTEELEGLDFEDFDFGFEEDDEGNGKIALGCGNGVLEKRFCVPPFSILDAKQERWQERKKEWLKITGDLSETRTGEHGQFCNGALLESISGGTSNFDPVLAEIMMKWFCVEGGHILDPFGGEQTKGVVAGELGYKYTAMEIRKAQVELNKEKTKLYPGVEYVCGDSINLSDFIKEKDFDMCFTSPPYYDLEVYSENDMSALGTYEEFIDNYKKIFAQCYEKMADDTFLVIKIGEIRDKKTGIYRNFVGDNIRIFNELGFKYYNELILSTPIGTAAITASKMMATRKVQKVHQNVLVFYKGNPKNIKKKYGEISIPIEEEDEM
jgi:DNA modification methylase